MCEPTTIAAVAMLAKGGLEAKAASDQAKADAATLGLQRDIERMRADDALQRGAQEEGLTRMAGSRAVSETKTAVAAGNVETGSGSAVRLLEEIRAFSELDALTIRSNAAREAWGHEAQAALLEQARKTAKKQGELAMLGSFLGTAGNLAKLGGGK